MKMLANEVRMEEAGETYLVTTDKKMNRPNEAKEG
jgi:hypothetical protein